MDVQVVVVAVEIVADVAFRLVALREWHLGVAKGVYIRVLVPGRDVLVVDNLVAVVVVAVAHFGPVGVDEFVCVVAVAVVIDVAFGLRTGILRLTGAEGVTVHVPEPAGWLAHSRVVVVAVVAAAVLRGTREPVVVAIADSHLEVFADERRDDVAAGQDAQKRQHHGDQEFPVHMYLR